MKKIVYTLLVSITFSCGEKKETDAFGNEIQKENSNDELTGQQLFEGKGTCATCHRINEKSVGPSVIDIAKIYKNEKGAIVNFLKGNAKPIVTPEQFEIMKANLALTKSMSDMELQKLEDYFYKAK